MTGPGAVVQYADGEAVKTGEFVTRRSHETYTVTTEPVGQQCSGRSPYPARCQNEGEGWLYDPSRPPAYVGVQFACRECADCAVRTENVAFTPGRIVGKNRVLDMGWFIRLDEEG